MWNECWNESSYVEEIRPSQADFETFSNVQSEQVTDVNEVHNIATCFMIKVDGQYMCFKLLIYLSSILFSQC